jgi:hypothetical protein
MNEGRPPIKPSYDNGGDNPGDASTSNTEPAMPGPRVTSPDIGMTQGSDITQGFGFRESIADVTPADIGADTQGGGQIHVQHPKTPAPRGTRFG